VDGIVGIASRYGMDGLRIESRWGRDLPHLSRPVPRPTQPPVQWVTGLSRGKGGRGVVLTTHPHLVCRGPRKRLELYLYSPCEALAAYNRMKPHFTLLKINHKAIHLVSLLSWTGWLQTASEVRKITGTDPSSSELDDCYLFYCSV
jgi:hypothetical protein